MYNRIKQAVLSMIRADSSPYPQALASYKGKNNIQTVRHSVYGVSSQPPRNSLGLLFQVEGMGGVQYGIFDYAQRRFKNLNEGELQVGNYLTQASIKFDQGGNVVINVPSGNLTAVVSGNMNATVTGNTTIETNRLNITATDGSHITGNLNISGDVTANNFISSGISVDFNGHIHTGDSGGNTSTPKL